LASVAAASLVFAGALLGPGLPAGAALLNSTPAAPTYDWATVTPPTSPPQLTNASAVYDHDDNTVVLFGGVEPDGTLSDNTWVWNGTTWTEYPGSTFSAPPARELAAMAFDPKLHQLILFGGEGANGQVLDDTWAWNGASWVQQTGSSVSQSPTAREGAAFALDSHGNLMLFGGSGVAGSGSPPATTTTTTTTTITTTTIPAGTTSTTTGSTSPPTSGTTPSTGSSTTTPAPSGPLTSLSDTWLWTSNGWQASPAPSPPARSMAAVAYDPISGQTILFGGESTAIGSRSPSYLSDTWAWNGSTWSPLKASNPPVGRAGASLAADPISGGLILYGGQSGSGPVGDTWVWNSSGWLRVKPSGTATARAGAAAAYDANSNQLVVFGGTGTGGEPLSSTAILTAQAPVDLGPGSSATPTKDSQVKGKSGSAVTTPSTSRVHGTSPTTVDPGSANAGVTSGPLPPATASSPRLRRGELVHLVGSGFSPGTPITITFHSTPTVVGRALANRLGTFTATVAVPDSAAAGTHHFLASGTGRSGPVEEVLATVRVIGVPGVAIMTSTAQKLVLLLVALAIPVITWLGLAGWGWRRRHQVLAR
jgi:hypothetical protein